MKVYTAHARTDLPPRLVAEGFSFWAFLFGPFWLLFQAAWIPATIAFAIEIVIGIVAPPAIQPGLALAFGLAIGVFGRDLLRWSLDRRGFALVHVVAAPNLDAALVRLLDADPTLLFGFRPAAKRA